MHTKGPWKAESVKSEGTLVYKRIVAGNKAVAFAGVYKGRDAEANARLIEQAPALLAELEKITAMFKNICEYNNDGWYSHQVEGDAIEDAEEAIRKARGE